MAAALAAIALAGCGGSDHDVKQTAGCPLAHPHETLFYAARATPSSPVTPAAIDLTVRRMCERVVHHRDAIGVRREGAREIAVQLAQPATDADVVGRTAQLAFYDWEPNVYGDPNNPVISLYQAVQRAAKERPRAEATDVPVQGAAPQVVKRLHGGRRAIDRFYDRQNDTGGPKFFVFGRNHQIIRPGATGTGAHAAPADTNDATAFYASRSEINQAFGAGGPPRGSRVVEVPEGIVVIKSEKRPGSAAASLGYWVVEDDSELSGADIKDPKQNFDPQTNEPIVTFNFTDKGRKAFARATKREADRGAQKIVPPGTPKDATFQRFAITLDNQIVSLATVSYVDNPEGIDGSTGAQINGIGNLQDTQDLAQNLRIGALPIELTLLRIER